MLILLSTIFFKNSTLNSAVVGIATCAVPAWRLQAWRGVFDGGRAQSGPLTALIGYLNVLLEYFDFSNFHWQEI